VGHLVHPEPVDEDEQVVVMRADERFERRRRLVGRKGERRPAEAGDGAGECNGGDSFGTEESPGVDQIR
jgi:hypothetical protein